MENKAQDDDLVMNLVELALDLPEAERRAYIERACAGDSALLTQVWHYVQAESRMQGFLLEPLYPPPVHEHPFQSGDLLEGRFRITREIAQGGMGVVYEAQDERLDRRIAIKCAKTGFRKRLPPEVRNAREISHPNVCKIFEIHTAATQQGEIDFLSMEFLDGETLAERLRRGALPEPAARLIARQLCEGLEEAHRNHVIHGDLKSSNIILTKAPDGSTRAVITDFGLARSRQNPQRTMQSGLVGGTPDYMAPELWKGEKASVASDIYALGVMLHELVSGKRPERSEDLVWKPRPVDPRWDPILKRCLAADPAKRFPSAGDVALAFAPPKPRLWIAAAAMAAALALVFGFYLYQRSPAAPGEAIRLAVLPFETDPNNVRLTEGLLLDAGDRLSHVKPGRARLTLIPLSDALQNRVEQPGQARTVMGATHALSGTLHRDGDHIAVRAFLTDTRTQIRVREWQAAYTDSELRNMPVALAGMVTVTLQLPALAVAAMVSPAAYRDWAEGVSLARGDLTDLDRALDLLERAAAADPNSPLPPASLAQAQLLKYQQAGGEVWWSKARDSLHSAEQRNPDAAAVHFASGLINNAAGRYEQAQADLQRAIEIEPMNGDYWRELGTAYMKNNRASEAVSAYQKAIELQPDYYKNYRDLGFFYYERNDFQEAVQQYKKMVDVAPGLSRAHFNLATAYASMGRNSDAEYELRLAIKIRETANAVLELGFTLMNEGNNAEAISYYLRALELGPPLNNRYLTYLNLGTAYRRDGQRAESVRAYRQGLDLAYAQLEKNPRDAMIRADLSYLSARLGDRKAAESEAAQALALASGDAEVARMAILTYEALGERERTLALAQDAPDGLLERLNRHPDLAELQKDPRFHKVLESHHVQQQ